MFIINTDLKLKKHYVSKLTLQYSTIKTPTAHETETAFSGLLGVREIMKHTYQDSESSREKLDSYFKVTVPQILLITLHYNK